MMTTSHFGLMERHARIDAALRSEQRRRIPDPFLTMRLKKLKLAIKDKMTAMLRRGRT